jgi:hypothetical protein
MVVLRGGGDESNKVVSTSTGDEERGAGGASGRVAAAGITADKSNSTARPTEQLRHGGQNDGVGRSETERGRQVVYNHKHNLLHRRSSSDGSFNFVRRETTLDGMPRSFTQNATAAKHASSSIGLKRKGRPRMSRAHSEVTFPSMDSYAYSERTDLGFSLFLDRRCKMVYFIGNAEGYHNLVEAHELLVENGGNRFFDAALTEKGLEECYRLKTEMACTKFNLDIQLIITSPLTRALQTSTTALSDISSCQTNPKTQSRCVCNVSPQHHEAETQNHTPYRDLIHVKW